MRFSWQRVLPFVVVLTGIAVAVACSSSSSSATSCDPVCEGVTDCGGESCLAYCISLRTSCTERGQDTAFADWAVCKPTLVCVGDAYTAVGCAVQVVETYACGMSSPPTQENSSSSSTPGSSFSSGPGTSTSGFTGTGPGGSTSGQQSTGQESSGTSSSACEAIGVGCSAGTDCCSGYCKSSICSCNTSGYACQQAVDCCSGYVCNNGTCVGNASTVVTCAACGGDAATCPGTRHCQSTGLGQTYCAQDCTTKPDSCPLDMTCTDDGTGTSSCIPNSGSCVASADAG